mmetsp:Transcript_49476/g.123614  ORF Transcript_49476/g.123614 Transcript_49476/m.123614 type:complete len:508 (+) Transcript_49476:238-1761(+)
MRELVKCGGIGCMETGNWENCRLLSTRAPNDGSDDSHKCVNLDGNIIVAVLVADARRPNALGAEVELGPSGARNGGIDEASGLRLGTVPALREGRPRVLLCLGRHRAVGVAQAARAPLVVLARSTVAGASLTSRSIPLSIEGGIGRSGCCAVSLLPKQAGAAGCARSTLPGYRRACRLIPCQNCIRSLAAVFTQPRALIAEHRPGARAGDGIDAGPATAPLAAEEVRVVTKPRVCCRRYGRVCRFELLDLVPDLVDGKRVVVLVGALNLLKGRKAHGPTLRGDLGVLVAGPAEVRSSGRGEPDGTAGEGNEAGDGGDQQEDGNRLPATGHVPPRLAADVDEAVLVDGVLDDVGDEGEEGDHGEDGDRHVHDVLPEHNLKVLIRQLKVGLGLLVGPVVDASPHAPRDELHEEGVPDLEDVVEGDVKQEEDEDLVANARGDARVPRDVGIVPKGKEGNDVDDAENHLLGDAVPAVDIPVLVLLKASQQINQHLKDGVANRRREANQCRQ